MSTILNKPIIGPVRTYGSDALFQEELETEDIVAGGDEAEESPESLQEIYNHLLVLTESVSIPILNYIKRSVLEPLKPEILRISQTPPEPEQTQTPPGSLPQIPVVSVTRPGDGTAPFFSDIVIPRVVVRGPGAHAQMMDIAYSTTVQAIVSNTTIQLNGVLGRFFNEVLSAAQYVDDQTLRALLTQPYTLNTNDVPANVKHLSDLIIRNQIKRDQAARLLKKTHGIDRSVYRLKSCEVSHALEQRYQKEKKYTSSVYLQLKSNDYLDQSLIKAEQQCDQNLYLLYKYLNSAVICIDECLCYLAEEIQAKVVLINEGVNVYENQS